MGLQQYITFRINGQLLGINILRIREINRALDITPVQHAPAYVKGLINLRGQTMTVFDLSVRLGGDALKLSDETHNIILKEEDIGLLVDSIGDVEQADEKDLESAPPNMTAIHDEFIENVLKLEDELLIILDSGPVLQVSPVRKGRETGAERRTD
jgi:purine-binding chemotaxis protein CheW